MRYVVKKVIVYQVVDTTVEFEETEEILCEVKNFESARFIATGLNRYDTHLGDMYEKKEKRDDATRELCRKLGIGSMSSKQWTAFKKKHKNEIEAIMNEGN